MTQNNSREIDYKSELLRKSIHLTSLLIPIIYYFIPEGLGLTILIPLVLFSLIVDTLKIFSKKFRQFFIKFFGFMLREHELDESKHTYTGATFVLLSALITVLIFPKVIFITAFSILIISDTSAALFGRKYGKHKFLAKSLEGSSAFFVSAIVVVLATPKVTGSFTEYLIGFVAALVATFGENLSYGWADDNFVIPLSAGLTMWILYQLLLPGVPLILPNVPN
jgi:dolichol kinase